MTHVCLGWGSLIWEPKDLPCGAWENDGPALPVEFGRISQDGRVTLVLEENATAVPLLWAPLQVPSLEDAIAALASREGVTDLASVGRWPSDHAYPFSGPIAEWATAKRFAGVVWTALAPGFPNRRGVMPSDDALIAHIGMLDTAARSRAAEYVRRAPAQIATRLRPKLQEHLE